MLQQILSQVLSKQQRAAGLDTREDDHNLYIIDTLIRLPVTPGYNLDKVVAIFSATKATIQAIQASAENYLIEKAP